MFFPSKTYGSIVTVLNLCLFIICSNTSFFPLYVTVQTLFVSCRVAGIMVMGRERGRSTVLILRKKARSLKIMAEMKTSCIIVMIG